MKFYAFPCIDAYKHANYDVYFAIIVTVSMILENVPDSKPVCSFDGEILTDARNM